MLFLMEREDGELCVNTALVPCQFTDATPASFSVPVWVRTLRYSKSLKEMG